MNNKTILTTAGLLAATALALGVFLFRGPTGADHHGEAFDPNLATVPIAELVAHPESALGHDLRITGHIVRQCPAAGCWFILKSPDGAELKVEMGDYTPTLPKSVGADARVEGRLIRYGEKYEFIGKAVDFIKP